MTDDLTIPDDDTTDIEDAPEPADDVVTGQGENDPAIEGDTNPEDQP